MTNSHQLAQLVEESIVAAAQSQIEAIQRLTGWDNRELNRRIAHSKESLDLLSTGGTPNYDDAVVALLYLLRYHYAHVNLAWSLLAAAHPLDRAAALVREDNALQVVDFGAGTSAMYCGLVLFISELIELGHSVGSIVVQSVEPSLAMRAMGVAFGQEFRSRAKSTNLRGFGPLPALTQALDLVEHSFHQDRSKIQRLGRNRLLSAMHTIYEGPGHSLELKGSLSKLNWRLSPTEGLMTFHISKQRGAVEIAPFKGEGRSLGLEERLPQRTLSELDRMCRNIGFVRYPNNPMARQAFPVTKDAAALHWTNLPPANILGNPQ